MSHLMVVYVASTFFQSIAASHFLNLPFKELMLFILYSTICQSFPTGVMLSVTHFTNLSLPQGHGYVLLSPVFKGATYHTAKSSHMEAYYVLSAHYQPPCTKGRPWRCQNPQQARVLPAITSGLWVLLAATIRGRRLC